MFKTTSLGLSALGLMMLAGLYFAPVSRANSGYLDQIRMQYQHNYTCNLCHENQGLNAFGTDFQGAHEANPDLRDTLRLVETWDSDGDGFTNGEELQAGTLPGNASSHP